MLTSDIKDIISVDYTTKIIQSTANTNCITVSSGTHLNNIYIGDLQLDTVGGTGNCIDATLMHRSVIENIVVPGAGAVGLKMTGCLLNEIRNFQASTNLPSFGGGVSGFTKAIELVRESVSGTSCNANTFIHPMIEGGTNGIYINAQNSPQGNNIIIGGVCEGQATYGLYATDIANLVVVGTHFEVLGSGIFLNSCNECYLAIENGVDLTLNGCRGIHVNGGAWAYGMTLNSATTFCVIENLSYSNVGSAIYNYSETSEFRNLTNGGNTNYAFGRRFRDTTNIFQNINFDTFTGGVPTGFSNYNGATIVQTGSGQADTTAKYGTYAAKITKTTPNSYQGLVATIPITPGEWVTVEAYVKTISGNPQIIALIDGGAQVFSIDCDSGTVDWQKVVISFKKPAASSTLQILIGGRYAEGTTSLYLGGLRILVNSFGTAGQITAGSITNVAAGSIAATDVQTAINELDTEKLALAGGTLTGALTINQTSINSGFVLKETDGVNNAVVGGADASRGFINILKNGTTNIQLSAESTEATYFNAGSVGIGKTNPSGALDVVGNIAVSGTVDGVDVSAHNHTGAAGDAPAVSVIVSGVAASRPASGTYTGQLYFATDTFVLSLWTGSAWKTVTLS